MRDARWNPYDETSSASNDIMEKWLRAVVQENLTGPELLATVEKLVTHLSAGARKVVHISELEAERDAAYAAGYRAGVEAAAEICAKHAGLPTGNDYENGWLRCACIVESEIRALLDSEAKP